MIDVPVRVKDALRDGRLRKNYRFLVSKYVTDYFHEADLTMDETYEAVDDGAIRVVGDDTVQFSLNVTTFGVDDTPTTTTILSILGSDGLYYVPLNAVSAGTAINPINLQSDSATVSVYHYKTGWMYKFTIDNDTLVKESVKIDDRMCSGSLLKFGLCEGASLEFQYFNHESIYGYQVQAFVDVQYVDDNSDLSWHTIPLGFYTVDQCPMQASTGIFKITAYNKLRSSYLDTNANAYLDEFFNGRTSVPFYEVRKALCDEYELDITQEMTWTQVFPQISIITSSKYTVSDSGSSPFTTTSGALAIPQLASFGYTRVLDPHAIYEISWLHGDIDAFEDKVYQKIYDQLGQAVSSSNRTALMNAIIGTYPGGGYSGCYTFFGIVLTKEDDSIEIYSKRAYDNSKYGAVGPMSDIIGKTLFGYKRIDFFTPFAFALTNEGGLLQANGAGIGTTIGGYCQIITSDTGKHHAIYAAQYEFPHWVGVYALHDFYYSGKAQLIPDAGGVPIINYYIPYEINFTNGDSYGTNLPPMPVAANPANNARNSVPVTIDDMVTLIKHDALNDADMILVDPADLADITARDAISAVYELSACFGRLDRNTDVFTHLELNGSRLLPADNLYPADTLYPNGNSARANKSMYQKLWTDSQGNQKFRYLYITYKGLDANNQEVEKVLQRTVNADGTTDYNMSDNWLFKNLVWSDADVGDYADAMVLKMKDISWFPFEMWCAGLPYIETGDELEITNSEGTYTSYVLQRQLNGIQNLQDTFIDGELDIF